MGQCIYQQLLKMPQDQLCAAFLKRLLVHAQDATMRYAQSLPAGTFGHAYGDFMRRRSFLASDRPPVRFIDDEELAYVAQRSREVHDLWHVLFNCKTTVLGELALKAVEFVQVGSWLVATCYRLATNACFSTQKDHW